MDSSSDERPTVGSLFSGIGGMDLGLERAGFRVSWQVEWDAWCQRVLAKHWPDVPRYGDITTVDWSGVERVDLLAGGFPCQPFSLAGQRRGTADDRWLWPAFRDAIRVLRPGVVLVENVPGLLAGRGMGDVLGDMAAIGYDAEWDCIPAAAVGAPHLRYRVWIVAYANDVGGLGIGSLFDRLGPALRDDPDGRRSAPAVAYATGNRLGAARGADGHDRDAGLGGQPLAYAKRAGREGSSGSRESSSGRAPIQSPRRREELADTPGQRPPRPRQPLQPVHPETGGTREADQPRDGGWWATEPDVGRVAHGVPSRVDRLRGLGNAVVPQVVEVIGRQLREALT